MKPYYDDGDGRVIYHGDCREVMAEFPQCFRVDALVTDPPYGIGFTGKVTKDYDKSGGESYEDTEEHFVSVILPAVLTAIGIAGRSAIFTGKSQLHRYPSPDDIGGVVCPSGSGRSRWGFSTFNPVLFYGVSPYLSTGQGARPTTLVSYHPGMHVTGELCAHPCPKPLAFMEWLVNLASLTGETVIDPFMGSGTTLVAAKKLDRKCIGIEINEAYCEIAARLQDTTGNLFAKEA